jgi:hypothetical protein
VVEVKVGFKEVEVDQAFVVPGARVVAELVTAAVDAVGATDGFEEAITPMTGFGVVAAAVGIVVDEVLATVVLTGVAEEATGATGALVADGNTGAKEAAVATGTTVELPVVVGTGFDEGLDAARTAATFGKETFGAFSFSNASRLLKLSQNSELFKESDLSKS